MYLKNPLKLVIWDLDETFWQGTLTEEGIIPIEKNHQWIAHLTARGILNSICSKNDPQLVQQKLDELGVSGVFVFSQVAFLPKGEMIKQQLDAMQLRAENTLFVDDRLANLEEATFVNPGLMTITPDQLDQALNEPHAQGKADPEFSRLRQYQDLEKRWQALNNSELDNEEFLRQSDIKVVISKDWEGNFERILELVHRTNQLNFTKLRSSAEDLRLQLGQQCDDFGLIKVIDRYADYGWVGFYAVKDHHLLHFIFSCRIMNMGVEGWLYRRLAQPELVVAEPVAAELNKRTAPVDWIELQTATRQPKSIEQKKFKGVIRAICNTDQLLPYLAGNVDFEKEFNYPGPAGIEIERQVICWLVLAMQPRTEAINRMLDKLPFFDPGVLETAIGPDTDFVILNPVMDYLQGYYRHNETGAIVPAGRHDVDMTSKAFMTAQKNLEDSPYTQTFLAWFSVEFSSLGPLPEDWYRQQMDNILDQWAPSSKLTLLLPNEQNFGVEKHQHMAQHLQHYNKFLRAWAARREQVRVLDFSKLVTSFNDIDWDIIYLYKRQVYHGMAQQLSQALNSIQGGKVNVRISMLKFAVSRLAHSRHALMSFARRIARIPGAIIRRFIMLARGIQT